jgi:hypothetical protein
LPTAPVATISAPCAPNIDASSKDGSSACHCFAVQHRDAPIGRDVVDVQRA